MSNISAYFPCLDVAYKVLFVFYWMDKAIKSIEKHSKEIGQYIGNDSQSVEEYFYQTLAGNMKLGEIQYDDIGRNVKINSRSPEFDVVLYNGYTIAIVEVKKKPTQKKCLNYPLSK